MTKIDKTEPLNILINNKLITATPKPKIKGRPDRYIQIIFKDKKMIRTPKKPISEEENECGFTKGEQLVHDKLMESYEAFLKLDREHPEEMKEFVLAIHIIQGVLTTRICRRCYPKGWPTYNIKKVIK